MPRRPIVLKPEDGPLAQFALELRALQDSAGGQAATIDQIAAKTGIHRDTLYAALRGVRIPTRPVLGALVRAWSGEKAGEVEAEWMAKRRTLEALMETMRPTRGATRQATGAQSESAIRTTLRYEIPDPAQSSPDPQAVEFGTQLQQLRLQAGLPSLREISQRTRRGSRYGDRAIYPPSHSTISQALRGQRLPSWQTTEAIVTALDGDVDEWKEKWVQARTYSLNR